jgi:hypothetical protein
MASILEQIFAPTPSWRRTKVDLAEDLAKRIDRIFEEHNATEDQQREFHNAVYRRFFENLERPRRIGAKPADSTAS